MLETIDGVQRFFASYPIWARALAAGGFLVGILTLLLAPRSSPPAAAHDNSGTSANTTTPTSQPQPSALPALDSGVWLTLERVELFPPSPEAEVQVTVDVNGTPFRYPSLAGVQWVNVGPAMSSQRFKLPPSTDGYEVRLEMTMRDGGTEKRFASQATESVTTLPFESTYKLHQVSGFTRAANVAATVRFTVRSTR